MRPPPWSRRWELYDFKGIDEEALWMTTHNFWKTAIARRTKDETFKRFDLIHHYREDTQSKEHEMRVMKEMLAFQRAKEARLGEKLKWDILNSAEKPVGFKWEKLLDEH